MKGIVTILPVTVLLTYCTSPKPVQKSTAAGESTPLKRVNDNVQTFSDASDTVIVTGSEFIPIQGKSPLGTRAGLEGAWVLNTINGTAIPGQSNLHVDLTKKIPAGTENRHDSTTSTQTINGVTQTTTTILIDKMETQGNKITPPQGPNYHIPERPSISFYGENETFSGFTGCNRFSGRYSVRDTNTINLQSAAASTKMVCIGDYDENAFLNTLHRATSFRSNNGRLELLEGSNVLLVFSKK